VPASYLLIPCNTFDWFLMLSATRKSLKDTTRVSVQLIDSQPSGTAWGSAFSVKVTLGDRSWPTG